MLDALGGRYILEEPYTERVLRAGVNATICSVVAPWDWDLSLRQIDDAHNLIDKHPLLALATTTAEIRAAAQSLHEPRAVHPDLSGLAGKVVHRNQVRVRRVELGERLRVFDTPGRPPGRPKHPGGVVTDILAAGGQLSL